MSLETHPLPDPIPPIVNLAAYRFTTLTDLPGLRENLKRGCRELSLKGTILLAPEGINLFIAGERAACEKLKVHLSEAGIPALEYKESFTAVQPFGRMKVKIKKEIIPLGRPDIDPARFTGPSISPRELAKWLDEGREVTLLDTRNVYEVEKGTFSHALDLKLKHFRKFPEAARKLPKELRKKPVVMFCTGGIRCEKASPVLLQEGFEEVYQLQGGILRYFEECGQRHFNGECFVFDERSAVDGDLRPSAVKDHVASH